MCFIFRACSRISRSAEGLTASVFVRQPFHGKHKWMRRTPTVQEHHLQVKFPPDSDENSLTYKLS